MVPFACFAGAAVQEVDAELVFCPTHAVACACSPLKAMHACWVRPGTDFAVCTGVPPSDALLDCKPGTRLSMPEDVAAVAHGDATLNLHSFMHPVRIS